MRLVVPLSNPLMKPYKMQPPQIAMKFLLLAAQKLQTINACIERIHFTIVHEIFRRCLFPELNLAEWKESNRVTHKRMRITIMRIVL